MSSGDRIRTCDLWVMSPTSYQLLYPAIQLDTSIPPISNCKGTTFLLICK